MSDTSQPAAVAFATFVGVDLHKQTVTLRAVNAAAEPVAALTCATKCVQRIEQWLLALPGPKLDGAAAQRWLLAHGHLLKDVQREAFGNFLDIVQLIERQREVLRRRIIFANRGERFSALTALLKSVPGIDEIWGCVIAAEVGDFARFPNADALEFWAGLTPDNHTSAGTTHSGPITKAASASL